MTFSFRCKWIKTTINSWNPFYLSNFDLDPLIYYFFLTKWLHLGTFKDAHCPSSHCKLTAIKQFTYIHHVSHSYFDNFISIYSLQMKLHYHLSKFLCLYKTPWHLLILSFNYIFMNSKRWYSHDKHSLVFWSLDLMVPCLRG